MDKTKPVRFPRIALILAAALLVMAGMIAMKVQDRGPATGASLSESGDSTSEQHAVEEDSARQVSTNSSNSAARDLIPGQLKDGWADDTPIQRVSRLYHDAETASDAAQAIELAESEELPVAKDWRLALETFCMDEVLEHMHTYDKPWMETRAREYCSGFINTKPLSEMGFAERDEFYTNTHAKQFEQSVVENLGQLDVSQQSDYLTWLVKNARGPESVDAIMLVLGQYINELSVSPWNPLQVESSSGFRHSSTYENAQGLALQMYRCYRFRSCGYKSIYFMHLCLASSECEEWWTIDDYFYNMSTPLELQTAHRILEKLQ